MSVTQHSVMLKALNIYYRWQPFSGPPFAALIWTLVSCTSHWAFNSVTKGL